MALFWNVSWKIHQIKLFEINFTVDGKELQYLWNDLLDLLIPVNKNSWQSSSYTVIDERTSEPWIGMYHSRENDKNVS